MMPGYEELMLPLLKFLGDGRDHTSREATGHLAKESKLSKEELEKLVPSGNLTVFAIRVGWAKTYLKYAGLIEQPRRGVFKITAQGMNVLNKDRPTEITRDYLRKFPQFIQWLEKGEEAEDRKEGPSEAARKEDAHQAPQERMGSAYMEMLKVLAENLKREIARSSPRFFQSLVADLLEKMGYGESLISTKESIKMSGDEGIDGVIKQDKLGLDRVYIQAKRWKQNQVVGVKEIRDFFASLQDKKANKGVFFTTSTFSSDAADFAQRNNIVLVNGDQLVKWMIDYEVGVSKDEDYDPFIIKRIDLDYFEEEE